MTIDALRRGGGPPGRSGVRAWMRARGQVHLYRNGYALIASSGLTSALGLVYWLVAARNFSAVSVGVSSALIAAMTVIANLCHLNLKSALNRFLPSAGTATNRMVLRSYLVAVVLSAVAGVVFVAGLAVWSPRLAFLKDRPELGVWFVLGTMVSTVFILQDSVLTGIRQAVWVPLENLAYAIVKLALLPAAVVAAPLLGPFVAWTAPLPLLVVPVSVLLFRWLLPAHVRATRAREERVGVRAIARYVASDYIAYLLLAGTMGVLPLVVLAVQGATANAYYFVSWSIAYGLYLIASGMGMSMITEAARDPEGLAGYRRQSLIETTKLMVPCVALVVLGAPPILGLLGHGYASAGTLLRLLALSALPWIVFVTYTNAARVERRMRIVVFAHVALSGLVLAIGLPLLGTLGINGLGVGWLAAQSTLAVVILAGELISRSRGGLAYRAVRTLSALRNRWRHLRRLSSRGAQRTVVAELRQRPDRSSWVIHHHLLTLNDLAVSTIGPPRSPPVAVLRRACSPAGLRSLWPNARALQQLRRIPELDAWTALVPEIVAGGITDGHGYLAESYLPGTPMEQMLRHGEPVAPLLKNAAAAINPLHDATATHEKLDASLLRDLIDTPLAALQPVVARRSTLPDPQTALAHLRNELHAALRDRAATTSWVHGDLSPGNILIGENGTVQGIVDWEQAHPRGLPQLDLLQLVISTRMTAEQRELGDVVSEMHTNPRWRPHETEAITKLTDHRPWPPTHVLVLLTWLHHTAANTNKSTRYANSRLWVRRNIDPVLASLTILPPALRSGL
jgi:O-antigen/teichoic acid export membrane protein